MSQAILYRELSQVPSVDNAVFAEDDSACKEMSLCLAGCLACPVQAKFTS